jgi:hypothetical protein
MSEEKVDSNESVLPEGTKQEITVNVALLINALKCIDAAAQRGAYQGGELSQVGGVRDALYGHTKDVIDAIAQLHEGQPQSEGL